MFSNKDEIAILKRLEKLAVHNDPINPDLYKKYDVKRGLRNANGTGVLVGLTRIGDVVGYELKDGEKIAIPGRLIYRGYNVEDLINSIPVVDETSTIENQDLKTKIEDLDVSEFEDTRITEQVAKEQKTAQSLPPKPAIEPTAQESEQVVEAKPIKKRGRKPKVKTETPEQTPQQQKPTDGIEKFKTEMLAKASDEANKFADEYFKTFIAQFKKAMTERMSDFQSKLDELFKS